MLFFLWMFADARHTSGLSLHFFTYKIALEISVLHPALVEMRLNCSVALTSLILTVTHGGSSLVEHIIVYVTNHVHRLSVGCQIASFRGNNVFICPAVSLYHMELVRKVFLYVFPNVSSVSMYGRYAYVFDEEDNILPFRDMSICKERL